MPEWPWPPGTIVVCVDDNLSLYILNRVDTPLQRGSYYTVRKSGPGMDWPSTPAVLLNEIHGVIVGDLEQSFGAYRFRPAESDHVETTIKEETHA